jgi:benzoyl-CoA reductase/2-hydroxyglutaryl-CoA dehydratase subunit BcrC/BadD/HgdB
MTDAATDYRAMWADLGLDLEKHDALLGALGQMYADTYLSQTNRPEGMQYFDFVMSEVHGLRIRELLDAQAEGRKVIGAFCVFVPEELVLAVDGILVGLCAGADFGTEEAEQHLPRTTCSLIKSFFGFQLAKVCPYTAACDVVIGENTCDGKKKSYEAFQNFVKDLWVMDMPQMKTPAGRELLKAEYLRILARLEELTGTTVTVEKLRAAIETVNAKRAAVARLNRLRAADPAPISGRDALLIQQIAFYDNPVRFTESVNALCDELEARIDAGQGIAPKGAPRVLFSGCPMAVPNWKLPPIVEEAGATIVGEESCVGSRGLRGEVEVSGSTVEDLVDAVVDRYWAINCAIFTPNPGRLDDVGTLFSDLRADGVIHYNLQFCHPYQIESRQVEGALEKDAVPVLRIDTDYGAEDVEQLRTRVEAFVERLQS